MTEENIELPDFKSTGWHLPECWSVTRNTLSCKCNCPGQSPTNRHVIDVDITKKEERMYTSTDGFERLKKEKMLEGLQKLAVYKCPVED
jgi:hypothetical protein